MALSVGQDSGYKKGGNKETDAISSYMKKLQEELLKKSQATSNQNRWGVTGAQGLVNQTAAQKRAVTPQFNWNNMSPNGYFNQVFDMKQSQAAANAKYSPQNPYLNMYEDWNSKGVYPDVIPPPYPYRDSHGAFPDSSSQPNSVLSDYVYGSNESGRDPYLNTIKDPTTADIRTDQVYPYVSPGILPPDTGGGGGGGGGGDYPWEYPVYSYGGGGGGSSAPSRINEWYNNMVQWNINRPKGG